MEGVLSRTFGNLVHKLLSSSMGMRLIEILELAAAQHEDDVILLEPLQSWDVDRKVKQVSGNMHSRISFG